jgi:uncharacterized protein YndB with AHSA1/START domain
VNTTSLNLRGDREIVIERTFDAPPHIVFEAWTRPEHVRRWWTPLSCTEFVLCEADVRPGGEYRYVTRYGDQEAAFSGTYDEVEPPTRLVYSQVFEPMADAGAAVVTVTFEARGDRTHVVSHELYPSAEARTAALASGMETGLRETYEQLEALVAQLTAGDGVRIER